jgi:hypothetical protein
MPCAGDAAVMCGASWRLSIYTVSGTAPAPTTTTSVVGSSSSSAVSSSSTSTLGSTIASTTMTSTTSVAPTPSTISGLKYEGCYLDAASRTLGFFAGATSSMAPNSCSALCTAAGYTYAGIEYASEVRILLPSCVASCSSVYSVTAATR